jgi:hypothetical protein
MLIPRIRGLRLVKVVVQIAAYVLISWTYAERAGLRDEFESGVRAILKLPLDLLKQAIPGGVR